jgi:hypothetical protein
MSRPLDHSSIDLAPPGHQLLERLLELAGRDRDGRALLHKARGRWVAWDWRAAVAEIERIVAGLRDLGVVPASSVVISGEIGPHLLLVAVAARVIGAKVVSAPRAPGVEAARGILTGANVALVFTQGRGALATWLKACPDMMRPRIVFDHVTADGHSPHPDVVTYARLRTLSGPSGWTLASAGSSRRVRARETIWIEETTDWRDGLDHVIAAWLAQGATLVFPEIIAAALRDRREIRPCRWLASAGALAAAAEDMQARFPKRRSLSGQLVIRTIAAQGRGGFARLGAALLRRRLGLDRLQSIDVAGGPREATGDDRTPALFRGLGVPIEPSCHHRRAEPLNSAMALEWAGGAS